MCCNSRTIFYSFADFVFLLYCTYQSFIYQYTVLVRVISYLYFTWTHFFLQPCCFWKQLWLTTMSLDFACYSPKFCPAKDSHHMVSPRNQVTVMYFVESKNTIAQPLAKLWWKIMSGQIVFGQISIYFLLYSDVIISSATQTMSQYAVSTAYFENYLAL